LFDAPTGNRLNRGQGPPQSDDRQVVVRGAADVGGVDGFTAFEAHLDATRTFDDMEIGHHMSSRVPEKAGASPLANLARPEESGHRIFGEDVHHRRCGCVENGDGRFLNVRQTPPRCDFAGMAGDASFFIGEAIPEEKNCCNGQRNDDENVVRFIRAAC
jgi:hypothetical protein